MHAPISRRDFLSGTALAIAGGLTPLSQLLAQPARYYPPALTGMRGSHPGAFEVAHQVGREGQSFEIAGLPAEEYFDLVVVGGGISGLAAAWFHRETYGPQSRILVLDNHDDFGGHAKRNEFRVGGRLLLGYGGTESLQSPRTLFSRTTQRLMRSLGVDLRRWDTAFDRDLYRSLGLSEGAFFDRETFGADVLVPGIPLVTGADNDKSDAAPQPIERVVGRFPMSGDARSRLIAFFKQPRDHLSGMSRSAKIAHLQKTSYREYLRQDAGLGAEAVKFFDGTTLDLMAMGPDIVPAFEAMGSRFPGFSGLGLRDLEERAFDEPYIYHFPDGNASIARLLVRSLIPESAPGRTMDDVILAEFDYSKLDLDTPTRVRLNSTVVHVANDRSTGTGVDIGYMRADTLHRVRARRCVLACWNMIIPHIMPELPDPQKAALALGVKMPLVYVNVAVRNWHAFVRLGIDRIYCPTSFFSNIKLDFPVTLGGYRHPRDPAEPILLHMVHVPLTPNQGLSNVEQFRLGRQKLLATPFDEFERRIVTQLDRILGPAGFLSARDIAAITVNRWPHGYAYDPDTLFDAPAVGPPANEIGRRRNGRVAIANSDAGWNAYTHEAIDQAWRAVDELKSV